jgi:hypothetical protein
MSLDLIISELKLLHLELLELERLYGRKKEHF